MEGESRVRRSCVRPPGGGLAGPGGGGTGGASGMSCPDGSTPAAGRVGSKGPGSLPDVPGPAVVAAGGKASACEVGAAGRLAAAENNWVKLATAGSVPGAGVGLEPRAGSSDWNNCVKEPELSAATDDDDAAGAGGTSALGAATDGRTGSVCVGMVGALATGARAVLPAPATSDRAC